MVFWDDIVDFFFRFGSAGGGGGGSSGIIGTPSDGTFADGAANIYPSDTVADAVDKINELLNYLLPTPPEPLAGVPIFSVSPKTGYIANGPNISPLTAGQQHNLLFNTSNITAVTRNSTRFAKADKGSLILYKDGSQVDSFDLESHFNESERDGCQSYPPANSPNGYIIVLEVCKYNDFPAYQKGRARLNLSSLISPGSNSFRLDHTEGGTTGDFTIFYDDGPKPSISSASASVQSEQITYLSGIAYYAKNTTMQLSISVLNLFNKTYVSNPVAVSAPTFLASIPWNSSNATGYSDPPNYDDAWNYSAVHTFTIEAIGDTFQIIITPYDPFGAGTTYYITLSKFLFNTYSPSSTDLHEYFVDEVYRLPIGNYDTIPSQITNVWDSTQPLTNGNAQVFAGKLVYPHEDFTSYQPSNTANYSSFTGDQEYYRAFKFSGPRSSGTLNVGGITQSDLGTNVSIYFKLPGKTGWLSLQDPFNAATFTGSDGDGAVTSYSQSGDILSISWTSGTFSTANSGDMIIVKIILHNTSVEITELWED